MSAIAAAPPPVRRDPANHILLRNVSWRLYRSFVEEVGGGNVRITYSKGMMEIMSPPPQHERRKKLVAQMVEMLTFELGISRGSFGSTTSADEALDQGLEPDECYYIANEAAVRGLDRIDLTVHPPPDLAIEVDISYRAIKRESLYAAMKVPEVWRDDGTHLECLVLGPSGVYAASAYSKAFPHLRVADLEQFLDMAPRTGENAMLRAFRDWIRSRPGGG